MRLVCFHRSQQRPPLWWSARYRLGYEASLFIAAVWTSVLCSIPCAATSLAARQMHAPNTLSRAERSRGVKKTSKTPSHTVWLRQMSRDNAHSEFGNPLKHESTLANVSNNLPTIELGYSSMPNDTLYSVVRYRMRLAATRRLKRQISTSTPSGTWKGSRTLPTAPSGASPTQSNPTAQYAQSAQVDVRANKMQ